MVNPEYADLNKDGDIEVGFTGEDAKPTFSMILDEGEALQLSKMLLETVRKKNKWKPHGITAVRDKGAWYINFKTENEHDFDTPRGDVSIPLSAILPAPKGPYAEKIIQTCKDTLKKDILL